MEVNKEQLIIFINDVINNGIPIKDSYAPVETRVNIITTFIGSIIGTMFTMWLFKKQEKMRIREEKRQDFYKEYKRLYREFTKSIKELDFSINVMKIISQEEERAFDLKVKSAFDCEQQIVLEHCSYNNILDEVIKASAKTRDALIEIDDLFQENTLILNNYKGKNYNEIIIYLYWLTYHINYLLNYNSKIESQTKDKKYLSEDRIKEIIKDYRDTIKRILDSDLGRIAKKIKSVNCDIEHEFLNQYFEKKSYHKYFILTAYMIIILFIAR